MLLGRPGARAARAHLTDTVFPSAAPNQPSLMALYRSAMLLPGKTTFGGDADRATICRSALLQLLVRLVGGPVDASGSGPNPANRMRLIASISKAATEVDQTKAIEVIWLSSLLSSASSLTLPVSPTQVDEAGWEVVGPTPLHTPPTSPITAMRGLPRPSSATNPAQRLMASTEDDSSWNAPRWTPACLLPPTNIAQPSAMSVDAQPIPGDDWSAPPWAIKARETDGLNEGWKAPRWARSPSPQTATRNQDAYVESWRSVAFRVPAGSGQDTRGPSLI